MSVMPGSLDYLYYNGILDHIPYEAYETTMAAPSGMGGVGAGVNGVGVNGGMMNTPGMMNNTTMNSAQTMMNPQTSMNAEQYLTSAMQGNAYSTYNSPDTFVRRNNSVSSQGQDYDLMQNAVGIKGSTFKDNISNAAQQAKNAPSFLKGLAAGGIIIGTLVCILKGRKKPTVEEAVKPGFWSKLNPLKWFKK